MTKSFPNSKWVSTIIHPPEFDKPSANFVSLLQPKPLSAWESKFVDYLFNPNFCSQNCSDEDVKFVFLGEGADYKVYSVPQKIVYSKHFHLSISFPIIVRMNKRNSKWTPYPNFVYLDGSWVPVEQLEEMKKGFSFWSMYYSTWESNYYSIPNGTLLDILISSLASDMFFKGITIHTNLQLDAFTVEKHNEHMFIFQEKLGICNGDQYYTSLAQLKEALLWFYSIPSWQSDLLTRSQMIQIITELSLSIIHTLGLLQKMYGIVHFDTKCDNLLLKFFNSKEPYFKGLLLDKTKKQYFVYPISHDRAFYIPNRGFIAKISDFSMARAHSIPIYHPQSRSLQYTSMFLSSNDPNRVMWYNEYIHRLQNSNGPLQSILDEGFISSMNQNRISENLHVPAESVQQQFDFTTKSKNEFGIDPENMSVSYDIMFYGMDMYTTFHQWFPPHANDKLNILDLIRIFYNINPTKNRPSVEQTKNPIGPNMFLQMLHSLGTFYDSNPSEFASFLGEFNDIYQVDDLAEVAHLIREYTIKPAEGEFIVMKSLS